MDTIGLRIRQLRKEQKLTLEALAGNKLTKGMLSLIENGKARPSMESLSYIAQQLGVESSELMEDVNPTEKRTVLEKAEKLFKVEFSDLTDEHEQIVELIKPIADKLTLSYESARLLDIFSRSTHQLKHKDWEIHYNRAMKMYEQLHLYNQSASLVLFKGMIQFTAHNYEEALAIIMQEHARFDSPFDAMTTIEYLYCESLLFSAVGNYEQAQIKMTEALNFSKEERIFYRIDDLYRLACFQAMINGNEEDRSYYLMKVRQYGEFAENKFSTAIAEYLEAHFHNSYTNDYLKANIHIERFLELGNEFTSNTLMKDNNHYLLEKGKSLYGLGKFKEALPILIKYQVPTYLHHPYDLSTAYEVYSYRALCYSQLGDQEKALNEAKIGYDLIIKLPDIPYKKFIIQTYTDFKKSSDSI
ncbi:helix-turn-helix domain-containing protein [Paenisporosarcina sp. TG-14]|uniref:helix-turn-helix domain-containing protein n=1 Tax=Paenisporosarcina sp. TG-14 TaxID=1231057 RepID=UPI0002DFBD86|nr:helix-turn-helix transcriptional regulator [Paenisporosarcina sp. TG-14]